ncbi:hypothetical protein V9T40_010907 [Parthenolecanium corni]|uniref:C2H2-type domain-containing protein n=1 Tax=Parthenolecanium corni TaxID=536013 RepID=A0AAN9XXM5_9HEMI
MMQIHLVVMEPTTDPLAEQRFVCRLCGKLYQWKQSLTRHIREDRCDKGPQHACPRCGIIFKHTTRLNRHILFCPSVQMNSSEANAITTVADSIISSQSDSESLQSQARLLQTSAILEVFKTPPTVTKKPTSREICLVCKVYEK